MVQARGAKAMRRMIEIQRMRGKEVFITMRTWCKLRVYSTDGTGRWMCDADESISTRRCLFNICPILSGKVKANKIYE